MLCGVRPPSPVWVWSWQAGPARRGLNFNLLSRNLVIMHLVILRNNLKGFVAESSKWCSKIVKLFKECYLPCKSNFKHRGKILDFCFLWKQRPLLLEPFSVVLTVAWAQQVWWAWGWTTANRWKRGVCASRKYNSDYFKSHWTSSHLKLLTLQNFS